MNVLVCNNYVRLGSGIDASVELRVRSLRHHGHRVRVFKADNAAFDRSRGLAKARLLASCLYSIPARRSLEQLLSTEHFDVVHTHNTVPLLTGSIYDALRGNGAIVIQNLHNYRAFCLSSYAYRNADRCDLCAHTAFTACTMYRCYRHSFVESAALNASRLIDCARGRTHGFSAHAFIANSHFTKKEHVQHGLAEGSISVLHNASEDLANLLDAQEDAHTSPRKKITFVGSLLRAKGVYPVLALAAHMPDWDVQLIGAGPEEAGLRQDIAAHGLRNVRLAGLLVGYEKVRAWHDSFVTVAPSLWDEPFGLVVPESYSLAIPVVSTGSGGMAETIRDGTTGFLQDFRDPSATAALLRALWKDEARYAAMRRASRSLFEAEFTERLFGERLNLLQAEIFETCVGVTPVRSRVRGSLNRGKSQSKAELLR
jgi:glycosyltransferase involved in cell wall biosynthesis